MPIKSLGEKGAWAYPGAAHFFASPFFATDKAMNFKFCAHLPANTIDHNKTLLCQVLNNQVPVPVPVLGMQVYKYQYQYPKIVLKYRSSTSTSTQYNKTATKAH